MPLWPCSLNQLQRLSSRNQENTQQQVQIVFVYYKLTDKMAQNAISLSWTLAQDYIHHLLVHFIQV